MKKVHNNKKITISESEYLELLKLKEEITHIKEENSSIKEENSSIKEENSSIKEENSSIKEENTALTQTIEQLMEQIRLARQKRFGKSSEQVTDELMGQLSFLFTPQGALSFAWQNSP